MSEWAHAANLACVSFRFIVAEADGELIGFIAIRDEVHLFNLFVARAFQGQRIGRAL